MMWLIMLISHFKRSLGYGRASMIPSIARQGWVNIGGVVVVWLGEEIGHSWESIVTTRVNVGLSNIRRSCYHNTVISYVVLRPYLY